MSRYEEALAFLSDPARVTLYTNAERASAPARRAPSVAPRGRPLASLSVTAGAAIRPMTSGSRTRPPARMTSSARLSRRLRAGTPGAPTPPPWRPTALVPTPSRDGQG